MLLLLLGGRESSTFQGAKSRALEYGGNIVSFETGNYRMAGGPGHHLNIDR